MSNQVKARDWRAGVVDKPTDEIVIGDLAWPHRKFLRHAWGRPHSRPLPVTSASMDRVARQLAEMRLVARTAPATSERWDKYDAAYLTPWGFSLARELAALGWPGSSKPPLAAGGE